MNDADHESSYSGSGRFYFCTEQKRLQEIPFKRSRRREGVGQNRAGSVRTTRRVQPIDQDVLYTATRNRALVQLKLEDWWVRVTHLQDAAPANVENLR